MRRRTFLTIKLPNQLFWDSIGIVNLAASESSSELHESARSHLVYIGEPFNKSEPLAQPQSCITLNNPNYMTQ